MTTCANHVCAKELENKVLCPLCRKAQYCSEACRQTDWVKHACPNASISSKANDVPVIEYAYEDEMPADVLAEEIGENIAHPFLQAYTTTHYTTDGHVEHNYYPPTIDADAAVKRESAFGSYKRGAEPPGDLKTEAYTISVIILNDSGSEVNRVNITGSIQNDAIYTGNDSERMKKLLGDMAMGEGKEKFTDRVRRYGRKLLSFGSKEGGSVILWPNLQTQNKDVLKFKMPEEGTIIFELYQGISPNARKIYELRGPYSFRGARKMSRFTRAFQKRLTQRLRAKFPNDSDNIKNMATYRMEAGGQRVVFTVEPISNTGVFLRDVEFAVNTSQFRFASSEGQFVDNLKDAGMMESESNINMRIGVDPTSVSQMTGLVMCLETKVAQGHDYNSAPLRNYARELNAAGSIDEDAIPDHIHTAIYTAVNRLASEKNSL